MKDSNLSTIEELLKPIFIQNAVTRASVFGSFARGDETAESDIDFIVEFADGASILNLCCLIEDIRDKMNRPTDVLTLNSLKKEPKEFYERVLRDARVIYEVS